MCVQPDTTAEVWLAMQTVFYVWVCVGWYLHQEKLSCNSYVTKEIPSAFSSHVFWTWTSYNTTGSRKANQSFEDSVFGLQLQTCLLEECKIDTTGTVFCFFCFALAASLVSGNRCLIWAFQIQGLIQRQNKRANIVALEYNYWKVDWCAVISYTV